MRRSVFIGLCVVLGFSCAVEAGLLPRPAFGQTKTEPMPAAKGKQFELRLIRVGKTFQSIRFNVSTGETWTIVEDKYEKVPETGPLPAGDYDVTLVTDDSDWMAFRIDRVSGTTWQLRGNKWVKVKEPEEKKKID
jgi:hypothetical protein